MVAVPLLALLLFVILAAIALIPLSLIQRFRMGTIRRQARSWVATVNIVGLSSSVATFLLTAAIASRWVQDALTYTLIGLLAGCLVGVAGLWLTRWELVAGRLHYTPNRWLVLTLTLLVTARVLFGFWRSWDAWRAAMNSGAWLASSGIAGSMAAGAVVLGYYLIFWAGVRGRIRRSRLRAEIR